MGSKKEYHSDKKYISPLLIAPINRLFIARPPIPSPGLKSNPEDIPYKPKLTSIASFLCSHKTDISLIEKPIVEVRPAKVKTKETQKQSQVYIPYEGPGDPFKTIIVSRIPYDFPERRLTREFERFGPISHSRLVLKPDGKSRGYAFIEYERERDARTAYTEGDQIRLNGKTAIVDVERGRGVVKGWLPRKCGGGLGRTRAGDKKECSWAREKYVPRQVISPPMPVNISSTLPPQQPSHNSTHHPTQQKRPAEADLHEHKRIDSRPRVQYDDIY